MSEPLVVYHTAFAEFSGKTNDDIIDCLYEDSCRGLTLSKAEWWDYQTKLWSPYNLSVPDFHDKYASQKLIDILVTVGALNKGPRPAAQPDVLRGLTHG